MAVICVRASHNFPLMFQNQAAGKLLNLFFLLINFLLHLTQLLASANQPQVQVGQSQSSSDLDSWGRPKRNKRTKGTQLEKLHLTFLVATYQSYFLLPLVACVIQGQAEQQRTQAFSDIKRHEVLLQTSALLG